MFVGQTVHYLYGGRCRAAMITDFWEDQSLARLTVFRDGGPIIVARAERGKHNEDVKFHALSECPDVPKDKPTKTAAEPAPQPVEPEPEPQPKAKGKAKAA